MLVHVPMPRSPAIAALSRLALPAALAVLAGCATTPRPEPPPAPLVPPESPGAVVEITLKTFGRFGGLAPSEVWFARVSALNGSDCTPRARHFDPGLDRSTDLGGADLGGLAMTGALEGGSVAGDPTCMYDEAFTPIWDPLLYRADRIEGTRAYLDAPPPARYVVVAATFVTNRDNDSTATLYLSADTIARTEVALPPGARRHMGRYFLRYGPAGKMDAAQARFEGQIAPLGPGWGAVLMGNIVAGLAGGEGRSVVHRAADVRRAVYPGDAGDPAPVYPW
jgi:hypothetical protein